MNTRLYPITEEYFKKHIDCDLVEFKDGRGRPPLIDFFGTIIEILWLKSKLSFLLTDHG